jgi:hypothetical protein
VVILKELGWGLNEEKDFFRGFRQKSADAKTAKAPAS